MFHSTQKQDNVHLPHIQSWSTQAKDSSLIKVKERELIKVPFTEEMKETHTILSR